MLTKEEAKLRNFIISQLRSSFRKYGVKYEVLKEALVGKQVNEKTGREAKHYRCTSCSGLFVQSSVQIDHREPVVDKTGFKDWNTYIDRLFCSKDNLQVLCLGCHKIKSKDENAVRRIQKKANSKA